MENGDDTQGARPRVLVTGARGYIGRHVVTALLDRGAEVVAIDRSSRAGRAHVDGRAQFVQGDIFDPSHGVLDALPAVDACLHLAWEAGFVHGDSAHIARLSDHYTFLTELVRRGVPQIAVLGTVHEVGYHVGPVDEDTPTAPLSLYGVAKNSLRQALEITLRSADDVTLQWLRCFYIYGDDENNNSIFTKIVQAAERGEETFPFTSGTNEYDFIAVHDLAAQIAATVLQREVDGIINCCSGRPVSLGERAEAFIRERGLDIRLDYGRFPDRPYDSPAIWGDARKIQQILADDRCASRTP